MSDSNNEQLVLENELSNNKLVAAIKSHFKPSGSNAFASSKKKIRVMMKRC